MENININAGGVVGAIVAGLIAAVVLFVLMDASAGRGPGKLVVGAIIAGAIGGNLLWAAVFPPKPKQ